MGPPVRFGGTGEGADCLSGLFTQSLAVTGGSEGGGNGRLYSRCKGALRDESRVGGQGSRGSSCSRAA